MDKEVNNTEQENKLNHIEEIGHLQCSTNHKIRNSGPDRGQKTEESEKEIEEKENCTAINNHPKMTNETMGCSWRRG